MLHPVWSAVIACLLTAIREWWRSPRCGGR